MADTQLEKLYVAIDATTANFNKQIAGVNSKITGLQATTNKASASMGTAFAKLGTAVAAAFSVAAIIAFTKNMITTADSLKTMAAQTGLSVTRIQELRYAVTQTGGNMDMLKRSIQTISDAIVSGNPALKQLGITTTNAGEAFDQIILKLADMGDTAERNVLGQELLGRSFVELKPLLAQGADGINTLTQAARTSGLVMGEGLVNRLDDLGDSLATLKLQIIAAFYPIVSFVLPALQALVNALSYTVGFITGVIRAIFGMGQVAGSTTKPIDNVTNSNNNLAKSAAAVKRAYAGFDELNVIPAATVSATSPNIPSIDTGGIGKDAAKALEDAAKAAASFNAAIQNGLDFWEKWGGWILFVLGLLALLQLAILAVQSDFLFLGPMLESSGIMLVFSRAVVSLTMWLQGLATSMGIVISATASVMAVIAAIIAVVVAFGVAIVDLWNTNQEFRKNLEDTWNGIKDTFQVIYDSYIKPIIDGLIFWFTMIWEVGLKPLWENFKVFVVGFVDLVTSIWNAIKPIVDFMIGVLGPIFAAVFNYIAGIVSVAITTVLVVLGGLFNFFGKLMTAVSDFVTGFGKIFKGIVDVVKSPVNFVIDLINGMIKGINKISFTAPDWLKFIGLGDLAGKTFGFNIGLIPRLATGGMPDAGSLFVAGEAGAELIGSHQGRTTVMPLENTNFVTAMKQAMFEGLTAAMGGDNNRDIVLQVGELELGRAAVKGMNKISLVDGTLGLNY